MSNEESNRLTRECLETALIYLMNEKPVEKITITELVKRSGVSRTAFYRNYSSKEDIISEIENRICHIIFEALSDPDYENNLHQWFCDCFQAIKDNAVLFQLFLQTSIPKETMKTFTSILEDFYPSHTPKDHYRILAAESAFSAILFNWFKDGMKEDINSMADICETVLFNR